MTFEEYQQSASQSAMYPQLGRNIFYPTMKLCGESGEFSEKVGKLWRNQGKENLKSYTDEDKLALLHELGDILWYVSEISSALDTPLSTVAMMNLNKLADRMNRNVIKSEGDTR